MAIKDLNKALKQIGEDFYLDGAAMVRYAREDKIAGKDQGNQYGTAYTVDGKLLYALVRELNPAHILEVGTYHGGSAVHMAQACKKNGHPGTGAITTIDIWEGAGVNIPKSLKPYIDVVTQNVDFWLDDYGLPGPFFDFIFEDGAHSEHQVHTIYQALPKILKPGGYVLSHDVSTGVGGYIRNGMVKGGVNLDDVRFYEIPGNPCGMSIYRFMGY